MPPRVSAHAADRAGAARWVRAGLFKFRLSRDTSGRMPGSGPASPDSWHKVPGQAPRVSRESRRLRAVVDSVAAGTGGAIRTGVLHSTSEGHSSKPHGQRQLITKASWVEGHVPVTKRTRSRRSCRKHGSMELGLVCAGRPWFAVHSGSSATCKHVNFSVSGDAAEDHASGGFDPTLNLEQLPPHPRPEVDRDVLIQVGLKGIIHEQHYTPASVRSVGLIFYDSSNGSGFARRFVLDRGELNPWFVRVGRFSELAGFECGVPWRAKARPTRPVPWRRTSAKGRVDRALSDIEAL